MNVEFNICNLPDY